MRIQTDADTLLVTWQGQTKLVEPWYGTEYSQEPISQEWLSSWAAAAAIPDLHLPHDNPFISSDFTLINVRCPLVHPLVSTGVH